MLCFFAIWVFFQMTITIHRTAGAEEPFLINRVINLNPSASFGNKKKTKKRTIIFQKVIWRRGCQVINVESSPLHIASGRTRIENLWFPSVDFFKPRFFQRPLGKVCSSLQNLPSKAGEPLKEGSFPTKVT